MLKKLLSIFVVSVLMIVTGSVVLATPNGKTLTAGKLGIDTGFKYISSGNTRTLLVPFIVGYGFNDSLDGFAGISDGGFGVNSSSGLYMSIKYQALKGNNKGLDLAFSTPLTFATINNTSVTQIGLIMNLSQDMSNFTPMLITGPTLVSGTNISQIIVPFSLGLVFSPFQNFDVYGTAGTTFGGTATSSPFMVLMGVEVRPF
ncbi:MAG: hypothetical protein ABIJ26_00940 [Candidatus Margulisiibacteriota bacterium]